MNGAERVHVVVIDDSRRFALHVWRILTDAISIGIGDQSNQYSNDGIISDSISAAPWLRNNQAISSPNGRIFVWWIPADSRVKNGMEKIKSEIEKIEPNNKKERHEEACNYSRCKLYFIIDKQGNCDDYIAQSVVENGQAIFCNFSNIEFIPVSAYHTSDVLIIKKEQKQKNTDQAHQTSDKLEITFRTKSCDVIHGIKEKIEKELSPPGNLIFPDGFNVLVTGAGFEIADKHGGFGLDPTSSIMNRLSELSILDYRIKFLIEKEAERTRFPLNVHIEKTDGTKCPDIELGEYPNNLDEWWSKLLSSIKNSIQTLCKEEKNQILYHSFLIEKALRNEFRNKILAFDWGFMRESLFAADMPFNTWISTNYTGFANRAVHSHHNDKRNEGRWEIISTTAEAKNLVHQLTHQPDQRKSHLVKALFKVHGDISHLDSMAIAGLDKEIQSSLFIKPDLSSLYSASQNYLMDCLEQTDKKSVIWHIVGHGLNDRLLVRTIEKVSEIALLRDKSIYFIFVNRQELSENTQKLMSLNKKVIQSETPKVIMINTKHSALSYLARLKLANQQQNPDNNLNHRDLFGTLKILCQKPNLADGFSILEKKNAEACYIQKQCVPISMEDDT